ncbi:Pollen Ole e 1 allergen and extensin family protein [Raphanus sativus]|uniref:Uncharacterized protein LOC108861360 n=1 Tax=Raphanus sativus TaxID=3726 RepID=A0A6J0P1J0_RAPSA|nr:uncharacterized protein LOC108861360 [Raphanus sativus]KAJ4873664.1 Pollen Ole e 1 allergen and extensin family protein [Raphanus sativus]
MAMLTRNKNITFSMVLICLILVSTMAKAQLDGLLGRDRNISSIQGRIMCSIDGNPTSTPPAASPVMLQCGGKNVATTNTGVDGGFTFPSNTVSTISLSEVIYDGCSAMVMIPLSTCNPSPPTNRLVTVRAGPIVVVVSNERNMDVFKELVTPLVVTLSL